MERIIVQLEAASLSELDQAVQEGKTSRAAFVRAAVDQALAERRRRIELQEVADSYLERPPEDFGVSRATARAAWPE